jgi:hypothetical protein
MHLWGILVIIVCLSVLFTLLHLLHQRNTERYVSTPLLVYDVNTNPTAIRVLPLTVSPPQEPIASSTDIYTTDIYSYTRRLTQYKAITMHDDQMLCLFVKELNNRGDETLSDIIVSGKIIGCFSKDDVALINDILIASSLDPKDLKVKIITRPIANYSFTSEYLKNNGIYALFIRTPLKETDFLPSFQFKIDIIDYDAAMDIRKLKFFLPYARVVDIDLAVYFKTFKSNHPIRTCISFDMILVGSSSIEKNHDLEPQIMRLIARQGSFDVINYYTLYIPFFEQTYRYITQKNKHMILRSNKPILEQFTAVAAESEYRCYDHPEIKSRGLCESQFDALGVLPKDVYIWDKPCDKDEECPFFVKGESTVGECRNGYCEMPLGVRRISYRKYDEGSLKNALSFGLTPESKPAYAFAPPLS